MIFSAEYSDLAFKTLKHFWGYDDFRDSQKEIIDSIIQGRDTLALLPTGAGKSLCYQLPALMLEGTCLVISPLLALMKEQVYHLKSKGIEAEYLSSELDEFEVETILNQCKEGITKILYASPERLANTIFLQNIDDINISFIAVDEAHCISEWGQDFRPSYQNIKTFRSRFKNVPCVALTATATPKVLEEIQQKLELKNTSIFQKSFKRSNIKMYVDEVSDKYQRIFDLIKFANSSGIVYTRTRKEAEDLNLFLRNKNLKNVDFFHAGLSTKEKNAKQNWWINSNNNILISTNAFGMGIDKDNVRFVIHLSPSSSIENYYQEIGRAGRNGDESFAFMLWNKHEINNIDEILKNQTPSKSEFSKIITYLYSIFQIAENELPEKNFQFQVQKIHHLTKISLAKIKNVLNFLHNQELIFLNNNKSLSSLELKIQPSEMEQIPRKDAYFVELLLRNISGLASQKVLFSELNLSKKISINAHLIKERIKELQEKNYLEYIDGALASIRFLKPREDRALEGKYWNLFQQIQKNKLQKWEEMKFYIQNSEFCKMKLILSYFGEIESKNCGICYVCQKKQESFIGKNLASEILNVLKNGAFSIEEISVKLNYYQKENLLENLIFLLDEGKITMKDFRTYILK